jgi:hypothetical protein
MKVDEEEKRAKCGKLELSGCGETNKEGATMDWKVAISERNDCLQPSVTENTLCTSSALATNEKQALTSVKMSCNFLLLLHVVDSLVKVPRYGTISKGEGTCVV